MATRRTNKNHPTSSPLKKTYITVGQFEKERGIDLHARKNMRFSTYLTNQVSPELGKLFKKVESL